MVDDVWESTRDCYPGPPLGQQITYPAVRFPLSKAYRRICQEAINARRPSLAVAEEALGQTHRK